MGVLYNNSTPAGVVHMFMGTTAPDGYLMCDGTAYLRADYPQLFASLGTIYDTQINAATGSAYTTPGATFFRIPDCRGAFLRVADNLGTAAGAGTRDPNFASRTGGAGTAKIGSVQGQATAKNGLRNYDSGGSGSGSGSTGNASNDHAHSVGSGAYTTTTNSYGKPGDGFSPGTQGWAAPQGTSGQNTNHYHSFSVSVGVTVNAQEISGDSETRPINMAVGAIIKT